MNLKRKRTFLFLNFFRKSAHPAAVWKKDTEASAAVSPDYRASSGNETPQLILVLHNRNIKRKVCPRWTFCCCLQTLQLSTRCPPKQWAGSDSCHSYWTHTAEFRPISSYFIIIWMDCGNNRATLWRCFLLCCRRQMDKDFICFVW